MSETGGADGLPLPVDLQTALYRGTADASVELAPAAAGGPAVQLVDASEGLRQARGRCGAGARCGR